MNFEIGLPADRTGEFSDHSYRLTLKSCHLSQVVLVNQVANIGSRLYL